MHEMGLAEGILAVVLEVAAEEKVRRIDLRVGKRQMVARDSLEFSFQLIAEGTGAAEAAFTVEEVPVRARCLRCGAESEIELPAWICPQCGAYDLETLSGDELLVDAVELEDGRMIRRRSESGSA